MKEKKLYRDSEDGQLAGVCSGIADYFDIDATLVRAAAVVLFFVGVGAVLPIYILLAFILPEKPVIALQGDEWEQLDEGIVSTDNFPETPVHDYSER